MSEGLIGDPSELQEAFDEFIEGLKKQPSAWYDSFRIIRSWNNAKNRRNSGSSYYPNVEEKQWFDNHPVAKQIYEGFHKRADKFFGHESPREAVNELFSSGRDDTTVPEGNTAQPIVYSNWSPAASYFGMNQETAYAEHMANTAHQREVADLKAAGLNPVLGVSGSGSGMVNGSVAGVSSGKKIEEGNSLVDLVGATASIVASVVTKNPMYGFMISNALKSLK